MPEKASNRKKAHVPTEMRGAIDRFEGDLAVIVFDDDQRLDCPRQYLPVEAKAGDAVVVTLAEPDERRWSGEWNTPAEKAETASNTFTLSDGQVIRWPGETGSGPLSIAIEIDADDTAARKERVRNLVNDIFRKRAS